MSNTQQATWSERLRSLSPERRRLVERKLREQGIDLETIEIVPRPGARDRFPLSFGQERLWFLQQLEPELSAYQISMTVRLHGELEPARLRQALQEIVRRHEILRTTFATDDGEPRQRYVHPYRWHCRRSTWEPSTRRRSPGSSNGCPASTRVGSSISSGVPCGGRRWSGVAPSNTPYCCRCTTRSPTVGRWRFWRGR